ncbi:peptide/nickel transport system permease protein [Agreia pratensis]|uniref:Peptide/nickel transport system permease protein n=1 Tax=Agreia pratensis TaxID=150121 RepID=A0A1X7IWI3_9MICO|nr:peptide/nickel transport system permease protein [Agreia pratensis]
MIFRLIGSRLLAAIVTMGVAAVVIYGSLRLIPGDPVSAITAGTRLTSEQRAALREKLGLNQGFVSGFTHWLGSVLQLDFGQSMVYGSSVNDLLAARMPTTVTLVLYAAALSLVLGLGMALVSATRPGIIDRIGLVVTSLSIATPSFVVALVLLGVFAVQLRMFPATGSGDGFGDMVYHLTLPAIALMVATFGLVARIMRATFREELVSEHVEVARSRGVARMDILRRHVVRNSVGPMMTITALLLAALFIGTAIVETAFGVDGIGQLLVVSIARRDFPVVQAISLLSVGLFVVTSTIADLALPFVDARVRAVGGLR